MLKKQESETILWEEMTEREQMIYEAGHEDGWIALGKIFIVILLGLLIIIATTKP